MDELTAEFVAETRETLERIGEALVAWERDPSDMLRLDEIFRFVHTVKGSCGFLDLPRIEALAHAAETALGQLRDGSRNPSSPLVGALLRIVDRIALLTAALESSADIPEPENDTLLIDTIDADGGPTPQAPSEAVQAIATTRNVRIGIELLDAMMTQVSDVVLARNELARNLRHALGEIDAARLLDGLSARVGDLRESIAKARMQPIERLFAALPRLVRDTAADLGKSVVLDVIGSSVELDREMVEQLRDPLVHIVRNAIDHGIETDAERLAAGKAVPAVLTVTARQTGNQVGIEVRDDGRGLNLVKLRSKAVVCGVIDAEAAARLSDADAANLIFTPGISTAIKVTSVSGRGVGMDVVRANIERLGGGISLETREGAGLSIDIRAPLTLSILTVLTVESDDIAFALPRGAVEEVFAIASPSLSIQNLGKGKIATIRGETMDMISLGAIMGLAEAADTHVVIIAPTGGRRYALGVARLGDHEEVVVRPVAPLLTLSGVYAGQALADSGVPLLVLDTSGIARLAKINAEHRVLQAPVEEKAAEPTVSVLLFTGLDGIQRAVRTGLVDQIEHIDRQDFAERDGRTFVMLDGKIRRAVLTGSLPATGGVSTIKMSDGDTFIGFPVMAVHDLARVSSQSCAASDKTVVLADGAIVQLVDAHAMFSGATARAVVAILGPQGGWATTILQPMLEAIGYDTLFATDEDARADMFIRIDGNMGVPEPVSASDVIDLHKDAEDRRPGSIDRYDRHAIEHRLAATLSAKRNGR